jgi:hypothetical protein
MIVEKLIQSLKYFAHSVKSLLDFTAVQWKVESAWRNRYALFTEQDKFGQVSAKYCKAPKNVSIIRVIITTKRRSIM